MVTHQHHLVVDCPVCGRPVETQSQYVSHELICGHCRGHFVVYETDDGGLSAAKLEEKMMHGASDRATPALPDRCNHLLQLLTVLDNDPVEHCDASLADDAHEDAEDRPTALVVEYRDEVFARIATDLAMSGMNVVRAESAAEALKLCGKCEPTLVVANVDLPDQSGWLLAGKLRFVDQRIRVWLYQPQSTNYDEGMASYLQVDELLDYGGDLLGLSETIVELMADQREPNDAARNVEKSEELAAA